MPCNCDGPCELVSPDDFWLVGCGAAPTATLGRVLLQCGEHKGHLTADQRRLLAAGYRTGLQEHKEEMARALAASPCRPAEADIPW